MSRDRVANRWDAPLTELAGVGAERAGMLARLGLARVGDLLLHAPRRYEDRRRVRALKDVVSGEVALVEGRVTAMGVKRWKGGRRSVFELVLEDESGRLRCRWWNLPYMERHFAVGARVLAHGRVGTGKPLAIDHPETETAEEGEELSVHMGRIVPVYPGTEGLSQRWLRGLVWRTLRWTEEGGWPEALEIEGMAGRFEAVRKLHFPAELEEAEAARRRLALDEFLDLQRELVRRRRSLEAGAEARRASGDNRWIRPFLAGLGFGLTAGQTAVLREIRRDMGGPVPMRRLLQGDVGAGKTVVAACAALMALESGFEVVLMAPTEILAGQHYRVFRGWFEPLGIGVELRTGAVRDKSGRAGEPRLVVGTHAVAGPGFQLERLGLVIIDEQHRFGVAQREALVRKGRYPHLLVMTATPIPRTLGLTLYGDLDVSVIAGLPAGRREVRTVVREAAQLSRVWAFVRRELEAGRQAYVVYPRLEESDTGELKAVLREWERLREELAPFGVGVLHGRLGADEKEAAMREFREGRMHVLVATSVIEVGVDVPNASVLVVENAEQFGLAQLHQLRGRVGRGEHRSYCVLVASAKTPGAAERLRVMESTADGFAIAEADLRLRGPGELLGREQSGVPAFRFGRLWDDRDLVERAREMALSEGGRSR